MRLFAIIEEKNKNKVTQLYSEIRNGKLKFYGFAVQDGKPIRATDDIFKAINLLRLSSNKEFIGKREEFDVILDRESGLFHFFKDEKEDLEKLIMWNGTSASLVNQNDKANKRKKINIRSLLISTFTTIIIDTTVILAILSIPSIRLHIKGEYLDVPDTIAYVFSEDKDKFSKPIEAEDIRNYIYNTSGITNNKVKDFIWNSELINDVLPYYRGNYLDIFAKIRHYHLNIQDLTGSDIDDTVTGEYRQDDTLYVRDYDEDMFDPDSEEAKTTGHEYIHLLQTGSAYPFIAETSAELISREYYMHSSSSKDAYSYRQSCKYLMILMEIIGPEPIWDNAFRQNSTMLDDCVSAYLTEEDFMTFKNIMNLSPYCDEEALQAKFPELESLINKLYMKKYNINMYEDEMINAIINDVEYDRVYFCSSLMADKNSYYCAPKCLSFKEAMEQNIIKIYYVGPSRYEQFVTNDRKTHIETLSECDTSNVTFSEENWNGFVIKDNIEYSLEESEQLGFIKICYEEIDWEVSFEDYMKNPQNPGFRIYQYDKSIPCSVDEENRTVTVTERVSVPKISEKFNSYNMVIG